MLGASCYSAKMVVPKLRAPVAHLISKLYHRAVTARYYIVPGVGEVILFRFSDVPISGLLQLMPPAVVLKSFPLLPVYTP